MSFTPFKEVTISNPGSSTRYGSDDLLDVMRLFNGQIVSNRRPIITNRWRWAAYQEIQQMAEGDVPTPSETNVVHLFQSAADNKLKVKKSGGTLINLEDIGTGTWSNNGIETISNKTMFIDQNTFKHSTTNAQGDILFYDTTAGKYIRLAKGTALQALTVNAAGTSLEWAAVAGGGGGGGEANTASNIGSAGIGLFYQKLGLDLQFKQIFSPDGSVNISDDTGNQKIDLTLPAGVAKTGTANTFGDFQQTFRSSRLAITNPANTFAYFFVGSAIAGSRNLTLPLLASNDQITCDSHATTLANKTLGPGTTANTDVVTLKHSTTNNAGELLVNTGTKFDRFARGTPGSQLIVNASGTNIEWSSVSSGGGIALPADMTLAPTTGRWGAFWGGAANGTGMMGMQPQFARMHGSAPSATESHTVIYTAATTSAIAEYKTACGFRRDSTCVFKAKWALTSTAGGRVKIGLCDATSLPTGTPAGGTQTIRYDVIQNSSDHSEFDGTISRYAVRFDAAASGLGKIVSEVIVRFRKYGTPSGNCTVGIRKNADGTLISLGTFAPNSVGSGEQTVTISAPTNTYEMLVNDRVSIEFAPNATDGMEMDEDQDPSPSGYTSQMWTGSSWSATDTLAIRIRTVDPGSGTGGGNTPLNTFNGLMVHGTIGTHTNYRVARNNAAAIQTEEDSTKPLANTTTHTLEISINSTNCVVTLDGTAFTYTTSVPSTTTPMAWWMHIETESAAERGLLIAYAQVVMSQ